MKAYDAQEVINRIAATATVFAAQAGVGAMETAGGILGYLAKHPSDLEPFMNGGIMELPLNWHEQQDLTWHDSKGVVRHPADVRRARAVKSLLLPQSDTPHDQG